MHCTGGASRGGGEVPATSPEQEARSPVQVLTGSGHCKWFNVRMGFGFISMTSNEEGAVDPPMDVFVHQVSLAFETTAKVAYPTLLQREV